MLFRDRHRGVKTSVKKSRGRTIQNTEESCCVGTGSKTRRGSRTKGLRASRGSTGTWCLFIIYTSCPCIFHDAERNKWKGKRLMRWDRGNEGKSGRGLQTCSQSQEGDPNPLMGDVPPTPWDTLFTEYADAHGGDRSVSLTVLPPGGSGHMRRAALPWADLAGWGCLVPLLVEDAHLATGRLPPGGPDSPFLISTFRAPLLSSFPPIPQPQGGAPCRPLLAGGEEQLPLVLRAMPLSLPSFLLGLAPSSRGRGAGGSAVQSSLGKPCSVHLCPCPRRDSPEPHSAPTSTAAQASCPLAAGGGCRGTRFPSAPFGQPS